MPAAPAYSVDLYCDEAIRDPFPHYAAMRALGAVVYLPAHDNYAITRYDELAAALRDPETFISGQGVAASAAANEITRGNSAASDGERHRAIRQATAPPLMPDALEIVRGAIRAAAEALVDHLVASASSTRSPTSRPFCRYSSCANRSGCPISARPTCCAGRTRPLICWAPIMSRARAAREVSWSSDVSRRRCR